MAKAVQAGPNVKLIQPRLSHSTEVLANEFRIFEEEPELEHFDRLSTDGHAYVSLAALATHPKILKVFIVYHIYNHIHNYLKFFLRKVRAPLVQPFSDLKQSSSGNTVTKEDCLNHP